VAPDPFAADLVRGVQDHHAEIDGLLRRYARGWAVERMPAIDRTLLRIGVFELLHRPDVPPAVAISEAVELANLYSTEDSGRYVNGVLARIADEERGAAGPDPEVAVT
jgi:N utilization substance protein B